jgi:hypothetical protein
MNGFIWSANRESDTLQSKSIVKAMDATCEVHIQGFLNVGCGSMCTGLRILRRRKRGTPSYRMGEIM